MANSRLEEIRTIRLQKLAKLRELGIDPYPSTYSQTTGAISSARTSVGQPVAVQGRLWRFREHGNVVFADLKDESGQIQLLFQKKILTDTFAHLKYLDAGDFLGVAGDVVTTRAGEVTIDVTSFEILGKTILPLPDEWHGLKDVEERYRKRYLDTLVNSQVKTRLAIRSKVITAIRTYLDAQGFTEVETPTLQLVYGGGFAKPFVTHHNLLDSDFYLRISDEMYLKRLIVGGFEKVYEITKVFRNEGVDYDHNPEFTMFEAQIAYKDYHYGMDLIEEIFEYAANTVLNTTEISYQDQILSFKQPWARYTYVESIKKFSGVDVMSWQTLDLAKSAARKLTIPAEKFKELDKMHKLGEVIAFVFEETVEEQLIAPTIIYDYPVEISPLAKKCTDPRFTQRFEMFAMGTELGNNYTELNDPLDLHQRFVEEKEREKAGFDEAHQTDYDYLEAIEHGFPPTCGIAIGIDRMVMLFTDAPSIKEVIAFPTLRPKNQAQTGKQDFNQKLVVVIDPTLPAWKIMNTSGHIAAFLGNKMTAQFDTGKYFTTQDGANLPRNTQYPIVTLSATPSQLKELMADVRTTELLHIGYVPEMMETTNDKKLADMLASKGDSDIEYAGVGLFGPKEVIDSFTKKFPLWGLEK